EPSATPSPTSSPTPTPSPTPTTPAALTRTPSAALSLMPGSDAVTLAVASARLFWAAAPVVVVGPAGSTDADDAAARLAVPNLATSAAPPGKDDDGEPLAPELLAPELAELLHGELARLGTVAVVSFDPGFTAPEGIEVLDGDGAVPETVAATPVTGAALLT